jgi:hypothetical protein
MLRFGRVIKRQITTLISSINVLAGNIKGNLDFELSRHRLLGRSRLPFPNQTGWSWIDGPATGSRQDHAHIRALGDMNWAWLLSVIGLALLIWGLVLLLLLVFT